MSVTLQTDYDCMVFPSKCTHLNFKLNIFSLLQYSLSFKGERCLVSPFFLCFFSPSFRHLFTEFLTLVDSLIAVKAEPNPSHVGALDKCASFRCLFLCYSVGL